MRKDLIFAIIYKFLVCLKDTALGHEIVIYVILSSISELNTTETFKKIIIIT
jgi:hypothetical protein